MLSESDGYKFTMFSIYLGADDRYTHAATVGVSNKLRENNYNRTLSMTRPRFCSFSVATNAAASVSSGFYSAHPVRFTRCFSPLHGGCFFRSGVRISVRCHSAISFIDPPTGAMSEIISRRTVVTLQLE